VTRQRAEIEAQIKRAEHLVQIATEDVHATNISKGLMRVAHSQARERIAPAEAALTAAQNAYEQARRSAARAKALADDAATTHEAQVIAAAQMRIQLSAAEQALRDGEPSVRRFVDSRNELRHAQQLRLTPDQRQELQDRISTLQQEISDAAVIGAHGRDAAEAGRELADMRRQLEDALAQQRADEELGARIEALSDEVTSTEPTLHPRVIEPLHGRNDGLAGLRTDLGTNVEKVTRDVAAARDSLNDTKAHRDAVKTAFDDLGKHKAAAAKAAKRAADEAGLIALSSLPSGALVNLGSLANFDMLLDAITSMASNVASSTGANRADIEAQ